MPKRILQGTIVSNKMKDTVVVSVKRDARHPKYRKRYHIHSKYKAHCSDCELKQGDKVMIEECRPLSRDKKWKVVRDKEKKQK